MDYENEAQFPLNNISTRPIAQSQIERSAQRLEPPRSLKQKLFPCFGNKPPQPPREILFNGTVSPPNFVKNLIRNQKYSVLTFIPVVLYHQFKFFFNMFFLLTAISQLFPALTTGYLISYVGPLVLVLSLTMLKEAYDDWERYKRDKEANSTRYIKLAGLGTQSVPSSDLKVGDIIEIHAHQRIPADILLLHSSEPNGTIFLKTDQLDGETDWKVRKAIRYTQKYIEEFGNFVGMENNSKVVANPPNPNIYQFEGVFETNMNGSVIRESLSLENTLWASTVIASGKAIGMVLYSGKEMRVVMNTTSPRSKVGHVELEINLLSKVLFLVLCAMAIAMVGLQGFQEDWYIQFFRFVILLSSIIPISLRVNLDFSKLAYCRMMNVDKDIEGTIVRNRSIPEELGRIEYLLTDKTGTLTQNEMIFKKLALANDEVYTADRIDDLKKVLKKRVVKESPIIKPVQIATTVNNLTEESKTHSVDQISPRSGSTDSFGANFNNVQQVTTPISRVDTKKVSTKIVRDQLVKEIVTALALCHNVTPVIDEGKPSLQASSPDEIALVETVEQLGIKLINRDQDYISIEDTFGSQEKYQILANFPFSSETKRMGIILRHIETGQITFFLKGADAVMKDKVPQRQRGFLLDTCENLAADGLRTLVITQKRLAEEEYNTWRRKYDEAVQSLVDRQENIKKVVESLEHNMQFLGITGVEDKLQEEVCNTLENLANAGIHVWMLTGDKIETAITIAISAGIKSVRQGLFIMKELTDVIEINNKLNTFSHIQNHVLVIDGATLEIALKESYKAFFESTAHAPAVVCCRCSPTQKALITEGVKTITKKKTCAIGDGGNDVGMIQAADVGIGIEGKEGKQAALAADYSILKFRYLNKLLLWHGRLSYKRSAMMTHFVLHRGLIISFIQAFFSIVFYDLSISIYTGLLVLGYTTIFTFFPVFSLVFDEDVDVKRALKYPPLYKTLQKGRELSLKNFFIWLWKSLYQAAVIMLLSLYLFDNSYINIVTITFTSLILSELLNVTTTLNKIHVIAVISIACSLLVYLLTIIILKKDINASTITLEFLYKVAFLTLLSWFPMHLVKVVRSKVAPTEQEKIMRGSNRSRSRRQVAPANEHLV